MSASKSATELLTIKLLGTPQVLYQGQSLKFRSRKVLALLIYLVVEGGLHRRDKLADLFWPKSNQHRGRTALRNTLARLRQSLAQAGDFLIADNTVIGFDFDQAFSLDVQTVDAVLSQDTDQATEEMHQALASLHGEFLAGFSLPDAPDFEIWATSQRELWHRRGELLFEKVAGQQLTLGKFSETIETATAWRHYAPLNEAAHRTLIEAYALAGDRTAALQAYQTCQQILADELGVAPSKETTALIERVKKDEMAKAVHPEVIETSPAPSALKIPLVGRASEYEQLLTAYQQVRQENFQTVVIIGEAGMGKTRLANTFLEWVELQPKGADVLRGRAFEIGGNLPYQPIVDALRLRLDQENAPDDLLDDVWLAELSQLLPELRGRYPDLSEPMAGGADFVQARLFEAVALLGLALAERQPLILFIDDVQWADAGSRELLHYVARRWRDSNASAFLLMTIRQGGLQTIPGLREWLLSVERDGPVTRLEIKPFNRTHLAELAQALSNDKTGVDQFGAWLHKETGGSPFFVTEMLQFLQQQALLVELPQSTGPRSIDLIATLNRLQSAKRIPLPPTIRDLVLTRLGRLSNRANALLLASAVIGRQSSFERLCQIARLDEFEGLPALDELLRSRLMVESDDPIRPFSLAHDHIRDVAYVEAGNTRRRLFHRQAFTVLEQAQSSAVELAFQAGAAGLAESAFSYAIAAGDEALALHAFADAATFFEQALDVVGQLEITSEQQCHLCICYGRALELSGRYQAALDYYIEVADLAQQRGNKELELVALMAQGTIRSTANEFSDFALGESLGRQALVIAQELADKASEAKIQWNLLNVYRMLERNDDAYKAGEQSLALARELGLKEQMAYVANDLSYVYMAMGQNLRKLETLETATALWRELDNQAMLTDSLIGLAGTNAFMGRYDLALEFGAEALEISQSIGNKWAQSYSLFADSIVYWRTMRVGPALKVMQETIQLAEEVGFTGAQVVIRSFQAQLLLALGAVDQARDLAQKACHVGEKSIPLFLPLALGTLTVAHIKAGDITRAVEVADRLKIDEHNINAMNYFTPELAICHLAVSEGNYEFAHKLSQTVLKILVEQQLRAHISEYLYVQAQALVGLGRPDEARAVLHQALDLLRESGGRWEFGEIAGLLVDLEEKAGNHDVAKTLRHQARPILEIIIEQIPEGELRASFMALPAVRQVSAL